MITRFVFFAISMLIGVNALADEFIVKLDGTSLFRGKCYGDSIDTAFGKNLVDVTFFPAEYVAPYRANDEEVQVQGKIIFEAAGLPEMQLQSLRLKRVSGIWRPSDAFWTLSPEDAQRITKHFVSNSPNARHEYFTLKVNGTECFTGTLYEKPATDGIAGLFASARLKATLYSPHNHWRAAATMQDVPLAGDIEICLNDLPPMRLQTLRLVYSPAQQHFYSDDSRFELHPDDAAQIAANYQPELDRLRWESRREALSQTAPTIGRIVALVLLSILLMTIVQKRIARQQQPRSAIAAAPHWWDE